MKLRTIAVIPARGGSKGIPRKNVRLLCGRPLLAYAIETALASQRCDRVVVSTEDEEIAGVARRYGATVIDRPSDLSGDDVTLDPVVCHAVDAAEREEGLGYDIVVTMQPTSPLLKASTLARAVDTMLAGGHDTLVSAVDATHLYWISQGGTVIPLYTERRNRQQLEPIFKEAGGLLVCRREVMRGGSRVGRNVRLFQVPDDEGTDIDSYADWVVAESLMRKLRIVFRVDGDEKMGLGHIYRAATLAGRIFGHDIHFLLDGSRLLGVKKMEPYNYHVLTFDRQEDVYDVLHRLEADVVINDILDTSAEYVSRLRDSGAFVVNFEDLGQGADQANIVVNALYENSYPPPNHYYGYKYECLRDEFYMYPPAATRPNVANILITFGGVDENDLTRRTLQALESVAMRGVHVAVVLGIGYPFRDRLEAFAERLSRDGFDISVKSGVSLMSQYITQADVVVTSNGRTVYEVASLGVPCISISQNEREVRHLFSQICRGVVNLGFAQNVSPDDIGAALVRLIGDYPLRNAMRENMLGFDLKGGVERTLRVILDGYWEWKQGQDRAGGRVAGHHASSGGK